MADQSQGLEAAYRTHRDELLRFLVARTGDADEAEDIVQDMWIRLRASAIGPVANTRAYLYQMAHNLVIDRLRERERRGRRERLWSEERVAIVVEGGEPIDPSANVEQTMLDREETALLASALTTLPPGARQVFELHKLQGWSHAEVAAKMNISKSGVEKHMAVAMKYLRWALLD